MPAGRPTKLNERSKGRILQAIRLGGTYEIASSFAGISLVTFYKWIKRGEAAKSGLYYDFVNELREAEGKAAMGWLAIIEKCAQDGAWKAAAWKLRQRHPKGYGEKRQLEHSGPDGKPIEITQKQVDSALDGLTDEQLEAITKAAQNLDLGSD
jgi:hypothetical protein